MSVSFCKGARARVCVLYMCVSVRVCASLSLNKYVAIVRQCAHAPARVSVPRTCELCACKNVGVYIYVCVCVCVSVCVCVCVRTRTRVCVFVCANALSGIHASVCTCVHAKFSVVSYQSNLLMYADGYPERPGGQTIY